MRFGQVELDYSDTTSPDQDRRKVLGNCNAGYSYCMTYESTVEAISKDYWLCPALQTVMLRCRVRMVV